MIIQFQAPAMCGVTNQQTRLPRATSSLALNASRDGASTTSSGNLCQCIITLWVKNFLLKSNLNLPSHFDNIPTCPITIHPCKQPFFLQFIWSSQISEGYNLVSPEPSLLRTKQFQIPQTFFIGEVLQPSDRLSGPPLDSFQESQFFVVLGAPGLETVLQMGLHKSWVEGDNHLPLPAGLSSSNAAQEIVGIPGCKRTLLAHIQDSKKS